MAQVTFDTTVGGDGSTVTDDASATTGLANGGHRTRFVPAFGQFVAIAVWVKNRALEVLGYKDAAAASATNASTSATNASTSATAAANYAAALSGTSTTSLLIELGSKSLTTQTGKQFAPDQLVLIVDQANSINYLYGPVTSYNSGTGALVVDVQAKGGSGTIAAWKIVLSGLQGPIGAAGPTISPWIVKSAAYTAVNGDRIAANTVGGAFSITLPASPSAGNYVEFTDGGGAFATNNLTVVRNGQTIMELSEDMTVSTNNIPFGLAFNGATWRIF